jgi:hypothetical protein
MCTHPSWKQNLKVSAYLWIWLPKVDGRDLWTNKHISKLEKIHQMGQLHLVISEHTNCWSNLKTKSRIPTFYTHSCLISSNPYFTGKPHIVQEYHAVDIKRMSFDRLRSQKVINSIAWWIHWHHKHCQY